MLKFLVFFGGCLVWYLIFKNRKEVSLSTRFFGAIIGGVIGGIVGLGTGITFGGGAENGALVFTIIGCVIGIFAFPEIRKTFNF